MTVEELKEALAGVPDNASVMIEHELICNEHSIESVKYDEKRNIVWLRETW